MSKHYSNVESAYLGLLSECILEVPNEIGDRELFNVLMSIDTTGSDLDSNFKYIKSRNINLPYQRKIAEWHLSGESNMDSLQGLNKRCDDYSNNEGRNVLYPVRIAEQIDDVISELKSNKTTRRSYLSILDSLDMEVRKEKREYPNCKKEYPCTIGINFSIRNGELRSTVMMRSNNSVLTICYDFSIFIHICQEVARQIRIPFKTMDYFICNAHILKDEYELAKEIISENVKILN